MSSILLISPSVEPLSLEEAKTFLRVEHSDDDQLIAALIIGARMHVEAQAQTALISQTWRVSFNCWPHHGRIVVRPGPLKALGAARIYDAHGQAQTVEPRAFVADLAASALAFLPWTMPLPGRIAAGIELDVVIGFGEDPADVPEPLRQAIRLLVAHWYENRGLVNGGGQTTALPSTVAALISAYRALSL